MMTKFSDISNSFSFQRAKIGENCKSGKKGIKKARILPLPEGTGGVAGFFAFNNHYSSTTKFFTSHVAEALVVLVYLKAIVTVWPA